jgi:hypothetical protein
MGAISQNRIAEQEVLALTGIEAPSFAVDFEYNGYGWVTSETKVEFKSDWASYKIEYEYDNDGNIVSLKKYSLNSEIWNFDYEEKNEYNDNNQIITKETYQDYGGGFKFVKKQFYTYDEILLETIIYQNISPSGDSFNDIKKDFYYNEEQQLSQIKLYAWIANAWMLTEVFDFEYDDFGNILNYSNELLFGENSFKNWRYSFTYNADNELRERNYYPGAGSGWSTIPLNRYIYHSETISESESVLLPNIYQFDELNFNWFSSGKKLVRNDHWIADCGGTLHFEGTANYYYSPFTFEEDEEEDDEEEDDEEETGIDHYEKEDILVYPNPTKDQLRIRNYELGINSVEIFDVMGKKQKTECGRQKTGGEWIIDISHFCPGIYFVNIYTEKKVITKKIMKP